jgi:hypothetical protein
MSDISTIIQTTEHCISGSINNLSHNIQSISSIGNRIDENKKQIELLEASILGRLYGLQNKISDL